MANPEQMEAAHVWSLVDFRNAKVKGREKVPWDSAKLKGRAAAERDYGIDEVVEDLDASKGSDISM